MGMTSSWQLAVSFTFVVKNNIKLYKAVESYLWKKRKGISLQKTYPFFFFSFLNRLI